MEMLITLNRESKVPIYLQVADAIHNHIERCQLPPKTRMPSTRELSLQLGVSRFTIEKAYQALCHQGITKTSRANGTFVNSNQRLPGVEETEELLGVPYFEVDQSKLSNYGKMLMATEVRSRQRLQESAHQTAEPETAIVRWPEMFSRARKELRLPRKTAWEPEDITLRKLIARYVFRARGINCTYNEVLLFNSKIAALDALSRVLLNHGDTVVIENPSCPTVRAVFSANGAIFKPIHADSCFIQIDQVATNANASKFIYLTPSSNAIGQQLSEARRKSIVDFATVQDAYIIEDDCGHELRYNLSPIPALKASDPNRVVIYLSDFDDVMLSALNCAYLVLPENLTALFAREQMLTQRTTYELSHTAMAYFMAEGHYDRHLRRIRLKYSRRRKLLIENINSKLVGMASIVSSKRTSLIVRVDESIESETILSCAIENGLPCKMTDSLYLVHAPKNEFEISFANVADECFEEMLTAFAKGVSAKRNRLIQTDFAAPAMALPLGAYSFSK